MNRRSLLTQAAMLPLGAAAAVSCFAEQPSSTAKVGSIEVFRVRANSRPKVLYSHDWIAVRLTTDRGLTGLGEASQGGDDAVTLDCLKDFFALLKGRSIFDVAWFRAVVAPEVARLGDPAAVAASSLEHCLWDLRGKLFGVPCSDFFGGSIHASLRQYANINRSTADRTPEGFSRMAEAAMEAGMTAVKLAPFDEIPIGMREPGPVEAFVKTGIARAAAVRQTIGSQRDLLVDIHSRLDLQRGLDLVQRMEALKLYWIEEVTPAAPLENLAKIKQAAPMPTSGGEDLRGVAGFFPYIKADAVTTVMPDAKRCGGMLEMKLIAGMAEGAGLLVSPHGPASPVGNVVAGHVMAGAPNFNLLELSFGENAWRAELIEPPEDISHGDLRLSRRPGLGILLNEKTWSKYAA